MYAIFFLFLIGTLLVNIKAESSETGSNEKVPITYEFEIKTPPKDSPRTNTIEVIPIPGEEVLAINLRESETSTETDMILDFSAGYSALYLPEMDFCVVADIPPIVDFSVTLNTLKESFDSETLIPKAVCLYKTVQGPDLSAYGKWITDFCASSNKSIVTIDSCLTETHKDDYPAIVASLFEVSDSCIRTAYIFDSSSMEGEPACLSVAADSNNYAYAEVSIGNTEETNADINGVILETISGDFFALNVLTEAFGEHESYKGNMYIDVPKSLSIMVRGSSECAVARLPDDKNTQIILSDFSKEVPYYAKFVECEHEENIDLDLFNSNLLTAMCEGFQTRLLKNCDIVPPPETIDEVSCLFIGMLYDDEGNGELACVKENKQSTETSENVLSDDYFFLHKIR